MAAELVVYGAPGRTRTCNLLFRRCVRTVWRGLTSAVLAGHVAGRVRPSHDVFGLVTAGGMTPGLTQQPKQITAWCPGLEPATFRLRATGSRKVDWLR